MRSGDTEVHRLGDRVLSVIKAYYWTTPIFLLLDLLFGIDIRVSAFIHHPSYKFLYYVFCFACMALMVWKPGLSAAVGLFESSINIVILCSGMMLSVYLAGDLIVEGTEGYSGVTVQRVINFILSGGICLSSFYRCVSVSSQRSKSRWFRPWDGRF
jgi:hypothetical protein